MDQALEEHPEGDESFAKHVQQYHPSLSPSPILEI
jgi:hypothetical protein